MYDISQKDFATIMGMTQSNYSKLVNGYKVKFDMEYAILLHNEFGISFNWLIAGAGSVYAGNSKGLALKISQGDYDIHYDTDLLDKAGCIVLLNIYNNYGSLSVFCDKNNLDIDKVRKILKRRLDGTYPQLDKIIEDEYLDVLVSNYNSVVSEKVEKYSVQNKVYELEKEINKIK